MGISRMRTIGLSLLAATTLASVPANALTINLIDTGGVTGTQAQLGFQIAARYWESVLTNNATVNFNVSFQDLGPGILGGTYSNLQTYVDISQYYSLLASRSSGNALDTTALANLRPLSSNGSITAVVPAYENPLTMDGIAETGKRLTPSGTALSQTMAISTANLKALYNNANLGTAVIDGDIAFSSTFNFDFDPTNGISAGAYDFIGVAVHEMGHALGFLSAAEDFDYSVGSAGNPDDFWWAYAADMFRYSAPGVLDWSFGSDSYFSLDGGLTAYRGAYFSTGSDYGDGWQASHWKAPGTCNVNDFEGVMNPYTCNGMRDEVTANDLALLDAIGWNTNRDTGLNSVYKFNTAQMFAAFSGVPEPTTWAMMIAGFGFIGGSLRSRRTRTTVSYAA